jgi:hypothetical protein
MLIGSGHLSRAFGFSCAPEIYNETPMPLFWLFIQLFSTDIWKYRHYVIRILLDKAIHFSKCGRSSLFCGDIIECKSHAQNNGAP